MLVSPGYVDRHWKKTARKHGRKQYWFQLSLHMFHEEGTAFNTFIRPWVYPRFGRSEWNPWIQWSLNEYKHNFGRIEAQHGWCPWYLMVLQSQEYMSRRLGCTWMEWVLSCSRKAHLGKRACLHTVENCANGSLSVPRHLTSAHLRPVLGSMFSIPRILLPLIWLY